MTTSPRGHSRFDVALLRRAVEIYLERAYPTHEFPAAVLQRLEWAEDVNVTTLLDRPPFERANRPEPGVEAVYALRLGNYRYPHMKLQVQRWPNEDGYLLSVNTHDQVLSPIPRARDAEAFRELQTVNQQLKEAIETAWEEEELPTFPAYLKEYLAKYGGSGSEPLAGTR